MTEVQAGMPHEPHHARAHQPRRNGSADYFSWCDEPTRACTQNRRVLKDRGVTSGGRVCDVWGNATEACLPDSPSASHIPLSPDTRLVCHSEIGHIRVGRVRQLGRTLLRQALAALPLAMQNNAQYSHTASSQYTHIGRSLPRIGVAGPAPSAAGFRDADRFRQRGSQMPSPKRQ